MNGVADIKRKGSDPLLQTARGKLQSRRSKLNDQINKELRMRAGAENLYRATGNKKLKETVALELSFVNSNLQLLKEELSDLNSSVQIYQSNNAQNVPMIPLGLKETQEVDLSIPLKDYISEHYSEEGEKFQFEIQELMDMRQAMRTPQRSPLGLELLYQYYNQLYFIEKRFFPTDRSLGIYFHWYDSLTGVPTAQKTMGFEKGSVLFNIAALYTQIGARSDRSKVEGIDSAICNFEQAAGTFVYLRDRFSHAPSMDMQPHTLTMLGHLMLAQAQECVFEKQTLGGVQDGLQNCLEVAHEAAQVSKLYNETHKMMSSTQLKDYVPFSWISMVLVKSQHYRALSHYYTAVGLLDQKDSNNVELLAGLFSELYLDSSSSTLTTHSPTKEEERTTLGKAHLREAMIMHEDSMRVHTLCKQLRKIDTFQEILKQAHDRSLSRFADLEEEDDFSLDLQTVPVVKHSTKQAIKTIPPDFAKHKVRDLFEKLGPIAIFSAKNHWSAPRTLELTKNTNEGYGFSVRGDSPVIIAAVEDGSICEKAGMRVGDFIISVGDSDTKWSKHEEMVALIRAAGNSLSLRLVTPMDKNYLQPASKKAYHTYSGGATSGEGTAKMQSMTASVSSSKSAKAGRLKLSTSLFKKKDSKEKKTKERTRLDSEGSSIVYR
ncbi:rhophilin-2-A-like isoform X2 [Lingula anatina]|uniref:Rhophilin-2-A-like isoform X2 n=1 Tax=Lingula anatina TaxID=7574 RepID=A0A1S3JKB3_LINAN|nr:rhophilin-2-A-like isoform X2 [Lingula anatina]|eukprot:XP_013410860.1 rhophilin-2-A-like isoform X2 [Lingula anatina]